MVILLPPPPTHSSLVFQPSPLAFFVFVVLLFCLVMFLLMVHSPDSLSLLRKFSNFVCCNIDRLFCMALVKQLRDDSWVIRAACCHVALVFVIMHIY